MALLFVLTEMNPPIEAALIAERKTFGDFSKTGSGT